MFVLEQLREYAKSDRIALINRQDRVSYRQMDVWSDAFAAFLLAHFGRSQVPVVIYGHKQTQFLPCMYGALKAGSAYVPVDITMPRDRVENILEEVQPRVFVNLEVLELTCPPDTLVLSLPEIQALFDQYDGTQVPADTWVQGADDCYILFTSGSTGKPKGVPINRRNLENLLWQIVPWCELTPGKNVIMNQISYSFDVSVLSVYVGVCIGRTLYTIDKPMMESMAELQNCLAQSDIALWLSTPSFAELCVSSEKLCAAMMPQLEKILFCGEVLTHKLVDTLYRRFPGVEIINTYGPTEATVLVTASAIDAAMQADDRPIPIGKPLEEVVFQIVDPEGNLLPEGETGELLILSDNVSTGYYRRPDLTAQRFFEKTIDGVKKAGYHTGDACYCKDGLYYFCGRIDFQVKLNGFRIELEDVENNLMRIDNVARAVVLPVSKGEKTDYLAAFLLLEHKSELSHLRLSIAIKEAAKQYLPSYMIPRKIIVKDSFPMNTNGKVDRKVLAAELVKG